MQNVDHGPYNPDQNGSGGVILNNRIPVVTAFCIVSIVISAPASVGSRETSAIRTPINGPSALATDTRGHLFVIEMNTNEVRRIDLRTGTISTVAGNGKECCYKDGAKATEVSLDFLRSIAVDSQGNLFIAEDSRIRRVDSRTGLISTIAGVEQSANTEDGAHASAAHFWEIDGLAADKSGNLFVADGVQSAVFRIDLKTGIVVRFAGSGQFGYTGDGGPAVDATFSFPTSITTDNEGNLIVADFQNCAIRRVDRQTGIIKTVAVTGGEEQNCSAKPDNSRPGAFPSDPVSDSAGNIYAVEGAMNYVLRIDANTSAVSIFAGNGNRGFSGDNGVATEAELANPSGLAIDPDGNVFIAEYVNNRIRRVDAKTKIITTVAGNGLPHRVDVEM
jgi:trimeric autotransporter adhesin